MSSSYHLEVEVEGFPADKHGAVIQAVRVAWTYNSDYSTEELDYEGLRFTGYEEISGSRPAEAFARHISRVIWDAAGGYCQVRVYATLEGDDPCDEFETIGADAETEHPGDSTPAEPVAGTPTEGTDGPPEPIQVGSALPEDPEAPRVGPTHAGPFAIGAGVPGVNDGSEVIAEVKITRHEAGILMKYWHGRYRGTLDFCTVSSQSGSTEWREIAYSQYRMGVFEDHIDQECLEELMAEARRHDAEVAKQLDEDDSSAQSVDDDE